MGPHTRSAVQVIGSGPNGLAAAIVMARAGYRVTLHERSGWIGGAVSTAALTLPGFAHDVCASVFALAAASPFFRGLDLAAHGLSWTHPDPLLAHPLDDGTAAVLRRGADETAADLGRDGPSYRRLVGPLAARWHELAHDLLAPPGLPASPLLMSRFAIPGAMPATALARALFATTRARALLAGMAAHAVRPLDRPLTSAFALVLAAAGHAAGWPFARGGAGRLADALAACARAEGVTLLTDSPVAALASLEPAAAVLCDVPPCALLGIARTVLPGGYARALSRFAHGPGVFKVDWALDGPIPWTAGACRSAGTVHVGGTMEEIAAAEAAVADGGHPETPFVILAQPTVCDASRAPAGKHIAWGYCHVPNNSRLDTTDRIERQVERFAPGFRDLILARHVMDPAAFEAHNPNLVGGDVTGGSPTLIQTLARPTWRQYRTPAAGLYLCSASTPPGGGVHGMCGFHAARAALRDLERRQA